MAPSFSCHFPCLINRDSSGLYCWCKEITPAVFGCSGVGSCVALLSSGPRMGHWILRLTRHWTSGHCWVERCFPAALCVYPRAYVARMLPVTSSHTDWTFSRQCQTLPWPCFERAAFSTPGEVLPDRRAPGPILEEGKWAVKNFSGLGGLDP